MDSNEEEPYSYEMPNINAQDLKTIAKASSYANDGWMILTALDCILSISFDK